MRAHFLFILFLVAASHVASAQFFRGWGVKAGATGGYQVFTYSPGYGSPGIPRDVRWGFSAGVFAEFLRLKHVSIVIEAGYTQKGRKVTHEEIMRSGAEPGYLSSGPAGLTPRIEYLNIGVLVKGRTGNRGVVPFLTVGPRFDFVLARSTEAGPVFQNYKSGDIGITVGAGFELIPRHQPIASGEFRWSPSFSKAFSNNILSVKNYTYEFFLAFWL